MSIELRNSGHLFAANLLFRSSRDGEFTETNLWEEAIVLVEAENEEEAEVAAASIGLSKQNSYLNSDGVEIVWLFYKVERIFSVLDLPLRHGSEVFSRFLRDLEVQSILKPFEDH
jgi:hypothetical protein